MRDTIDTSQSILIRSTTPKALDAFLNEQFPGVTDRVSAADRRAIVLASVALSLDAVASRFVDGHMQKVEQAWALTEGGEG